jgi:hypothetical protein
MIAGTILREIVASEIHVILAEVLVVAVEAAVEEDYQTEIRTVGIQKIVGTILRNLINVSSVMIGLGLS